MDLVSYSKGGVRAASGLHLHDDVSDLHEDVVGKDQSSERSEPKLASYHFDAGAGTKGPRKSWRAPAASYGGLRGVGNSSEHGLHYFLLTEEIELEIETKSIHNLES